MQDINEGKHNTESWYDSHFLHQGDLTCPPLVLNWHLIIIPRRIKTGNASKLLFHSVIQLHSCTLDQRLIRHTQVACLESNLADYFPWRLDPLDVCEVNTVHTFAHSKRNGFYFHQYVSFGHSTGKMSCLWALWWLLSFICSALGHTEKPTTPQIPSSLFAHVWCEV